MNNAVAELVTELSEAQTCIEKLTAEKLALEKELAAAKAAPAPTSAFQLIASARRQLRSALDTCSAEDRRDYIKWADEDLAKAGKLEDAAPAPQYVPPAGQAVHVQIRNGEGGVLAIAIGEEVLAGMFEGHRFALHNNVALGRAGHFTVSHLETGNHIATGNTPESTVQRARERLAEKTKADLDAAQAAAQGTAPAPDGDAGEFYDAEG